MRDHLKSDTVLDGHEVVSERLYKERQSWHYRTIFLVDGRKVRVRIERNAYDFQSHAKAELWASNKWEPVTSMPIEACKCLPVSYVHRPGDFSIGLFRDDALELLQEATAIVI